MLDELQHDAAQQDAGQQAESGGRAHGQDSRDGEDPIVLPELAQGVQAAADQLDEDIRTMREAARVVVVVVAAADKVADRFTRLDPDAVCRSLGLDADVV
ncbi:MAG: hypothetical protein ACYDC9_05935 [Dermatophilaceae bacterium]